MKLDTPEYRKIFTPELQQLLDIFQRHGYEIRLAGGPVRDLLMGIVPNDLDFATVATPEEMKTMFAQENIRIINTKGEKHGTITARINNVENFEITTLRIDVVNHGRHADVEFTQDWQLDANRRDLTVNSMFLGFDGTVYDYFGGREDLQKRRVAFVGDAAQRICEDYLRILRYFRFCGRLSLHPDHHEPQTLQAIRENVGGLARISGERIWMELKKILAAKDAGPLLETMLELDMGQYMGLPSDVNMAEFRRVWDRCQQTKLTLEPITLLASLFNNQEEVLLLRDRLKFTTFEKELALFIVQHRDILPDLKPLRPYQWLAVDHHNKQKDTLQWVLQLLKYLGHVQLAEEFQKWTPPRFPISGNTLKQCRVPVGKSMTLVMQRLKDQWKRSDFELNEEQLTAMIPKVLDDLGIVSKK